ncbi:MAG: hypothetical protein KGI60_00485 [Patescibacteria group bacterium]|nr:hypothetical protein [Patescibacteria group bacterium]
MPRQNPEFLHKKYSDLSGSKPVEKAVQKARREGEPIPDKKLARIQTYLDRMEKIVDSERGGELLKHKLRKEFAWDTSDPDAMERVSRALYASERKIMRERGQSEELRELERRVSEQERLDFLKPEIEEKSRVQLRTLDIWLEYLRENDAEYEMWFRYYVARNLQKMGAFNKEKGEYAKRTKETLAPFPELNAEALGDVKRWLTSGIGDQEFTGPEGLKKKEKLQKLIANADFGGLYALAQIESAGKLNRESIEGQWIKYDQGSDPHILENALKGKGTEWCTASGAAPAHLKGGDFYVYFTKGLKGTYTEPRIAIRMENDHVAEVRGVRPGTTQELEPELIDIAREKYHPLPGGDNYDRKADDMKRLTEIERKNQKGEPPSKEDLRFLYEIDGKIQGFGYGHDPRIEELKKGRNIKKDLSFALDIPEGKISTTQEEALKGGILYHYGSLNLSKLTSAEGLTLPQSVGGHLNLSGLTSAEKNTLKKKYPHFSII